MTLLRTSILKPVFGDQKQDAGAASDGTPETTASGRQGLRAAAAHRIRVGLTGLAAIFLVVLIAAAGIRPTRSLAAADSHSEPLAVLGVAPGAVADK